MHATSFLIIYSILFAIHSYDIVHKHHGAGGVLHTNNKRHDPTQPARSMQAVYPSQWVMTFSKIIPRFESGYCGAICFKRNHCQYSAFSPTITEG